jgi:SAM-dependent methyltransferase
MNTRSDLLEGKRQEMLSVNQAQRTFYETDASQRGNRVTKLWRQSRNAMFQIRKELGITDLIHQRHLEWLGDLQGKRVLDLGCASGNTLSLDIAERSGYYVGIDLSEPSIETLRQKLRAKNLPHADAQAMDFLTPDFPYEPFDLIYAYAVMHHFRHFDAFLEVLHRRLVPGGRVITFDPMQTCWEVRAARAVYRPFQSDADWEWPFTRQSIRQIEQYFDIEAIQGVMGHAKWSLPLALLPGGHGLAMQVGSRLHERDRQSAVKQGSGLWRCMQVALHLRRRD